MAVSQAVLWKVLVAVDDNETLTASYRLSPDVTLSEIIEMWKNDFDLSGHWAFVSADDVKFHDSMTLKMVGETRPKMVYLIAELIDEPAPTPNTEIFFDLKDRYHNLSVNPNDRLYEVLWRIPEKERPKCLECNGSRLNLKHTVEQSGLKDKSVLYEPSCSVSVKLSSGCTRLFEMPLNSLVWNLKEKVNFYEANDFSFMYRGRCLKFDESVKELTQVVEVASAKFVVKVNGRRIQWITKDEPVPVSEFLCQLAAAAANIDTKMLATLDFICVGCQRRIRHSEDYVQKLPLDCCKERSLTLDAVPSSTSDIFISYWRDDEKDASQIFGHLVDKGLTCSMNEQNEDDEEEVHEETDLILKNCKVVLACLTEGYMKSKKCINEIVRVDYWKRHSRSEFPEIIPVVMEEMESPTRDMGRTMNTILSQKTVIRLHKGDLLSWSGARVGKLMKELYGITERPKSTGNVAAKRIHNFQEHWAQWRWKDSSSASSRSVCREMKKFTEEGIDYNMFIRWNDNLQRKIKELEVVIATFKTKSIESEKEIESLRYTNLRSKKEIEILNEENDKLYKEIGVNLFICYHPGHFSPASCPEVQSEGQLPFDTYNYLSFIKCQVRGIRPGSTPAEEVRSILQRLFTQGEIATIYQRLGSVEGKTVTVATSQDEDEVVEAEVGPYCSVDGTQHTWEEAGKPGGLIIPEGGNVFFCGGGRRTVLSILW